MSWTLCTSGSAIVKAGANASAILCSGSGIVQNTDGKTGAQCLAEFSDEVEGTICTKTRYNWVSNYSSITSQFKPILAELSSDLIAMKIMGYDLSGWGSKNEYLTMLNILKDNSDKCFDALEKDEIKKKIGAT